MELASLQEAMLDAIVTGDASRLAPLAENADAGVAVYHNNRRSGIRSALSLRFPLTKIWVGAECFDALTERYGQEFPSTDGNLDRYGEEFPLYLAAREELRPFPFLPELAEYERLRHMVYGMPDPPARPAFPSLPADSPLWASVLFYASPALALMQGRHDVLAFAEVAEAGGDGAERLSYAPGVRHTLVYRDKDCAVRAERLSEIWAAMLSACVKGGDADALARAARGNGTQAQEFLARAIAKGWVTGAEIAGEPDGGERE